MLLHHFSTIINQTVLLFLPMRGEISLDTVRSYMVFPVKESIFKKVKKKNRNNKGFYKKK